MAEVRLVCDAMLGSLSRLLRVMGFDAAYAASDAQDAQVVDLARREGRVLVTRDFPLTRRAAAAGVESVLLRNVPVEEQATILLAHLGLFPDAARFFTRCTRCNDVLEPVAAKDVADQVPPPVAARHDAFTRCPRCGQVYWPGTHVASMEQRLRRLVEALADGSGGQDEAG